MLWTLLIVTANNLPASKKTKRNSASSSKTSNRFHRAQTTSEYANISASFGTPEGPVKDFVSLVHTMAKIFPDANTRMVLNSVLQDYDLREVCAMLCSRVLF